MERITSRKNKTVAHLRALGADRSYRKETGLFLCDGEKMLLEALAFGADIECVLWAEASAFELSGSAAIQLTAPAELVEYVSPLKTSLGPVFSVRMREPATIVPLESAIVLESVQDPGNVGTILRTADALNIGAVLLVGNCADIYNPKTVRSTMGAIFRQPVLPLDIDELRGFLTENKLKLYGAALSETACDIRAVDTDGIVVAIGSEGEGLSKELLSMCDGQVIIPMTNGSQSLNAAVAAAIAMWEMRRSKEAPECPH